MKRKNVIIVGAGFAGLQLAKHLDEKYFDVLLIDKLNHHQFQPLFYQVATSQIEPSSISFPIRNIFKKQNNITIRLAEFQKVNAANNSITTDIGEFNYDYLVLAIGCKTNFYGNAEIEKNAFSLKSTYEAITIRNHILLTFEKIISANESEKEALMNLVIVGGGPTGVELAGSFAEIKTHVLPKDYPNIDFSNFNITLVEGSKHTLNSMSEKSKNASEMYLRKLGVNIITEVFVKNYDGETLTFNNGNSIKTKTLIWAAGVTANTFEGIQKDVYTTGNRIKVNRQNVIEGYETIFAIGDIAYMPTPLYPNGHPQLANVAINQAKNVARNLNAKITGKSPTDYEYKDLGSMATIGRNKAVVDLNSIHLKGFFAWVIWMSLHLMLILSVRNKLIIFINWAWTYLTKDSSLRLILTSKKSLNKES